MEEFLDNIGLSDLNEIFFIYKNCLTIGLDNHMQGYLITMPNYLTDCKLFHVKDNNYVRPIKIHTSGNGDFVISKRDM